jgi:glucose dehydrogenase
MDPESGIMYVQSRKACGAGSLQPPDDDTGGPEGPPGMTVVDFASGGGGGFSAIDGLPIFKPPYGRITAIDMNTGEHLWWIPNGDTPDRIKNHPLLAGLEIPNTGNQSDATVLVTRSLLMFAEGRGGRPVWYAVDKRTGERVGTVEIPAPVSTAPMTFLHDGVQYIVLSIAGNGIPGSLAALRLPE